MSAPYYYGEIGKKDGAIMNEPQVCLGTGRNSAPVPQITTPTQMQGHHSLTDESPYSSSLSSRPSSSSNNNTMIAHSQSQYGIADSLPTGVPQSNIPSSFANPLLNIEPDTRGSESLPRSFNQARKPNLFQKQAQKKESSSIYQRSLSLLANGVSPLLRKKNSAKPVENKLPENTLSSSASSLARRRRKSEPIMFSLDSITNEISRLQQRQEQILENLNLDFETMLMNDTMPTGNGVASNQTNSVSSGDYGRTMQQPGGSIYKEPLYILYDDSHRSTRAEDNIYEEIDFMTLSSLRQQYADTLSLQSWKKKGSKRSLASSSFTRWFSTRKKNSPSTNSSDLDENPYIDVKISKKQRPPICLPDVPPQGLLPDQLKRRYIVGSIVDSENSYINSLQRIICDYKKPMEDANPTVLSQNKINIIFHRLEQILQCHTIFGIALSQCVREWDEKERIGDVFIASFSKSMVLDIYSDFINNFTNAMEVARKASKSKSAFAQFLHDKSLSSPDRLSFFGLMVKPVQRFPQFILLLSDLLNHTPSDHHDRMSLQLALTQLESLADRLNERKRDAERHFAVKQLLKDYISSSTNSNRYLLRQDDIYMLDLDASTGLVLKTKCRKLYLLNDMMVCVSVPSNRLKFAVQLQDVDVIDDVTPATNNLIANSMLRTKDANASQPSSPQHCSVERMYCDLNNLIHDLELMSRITNLVSSLRYQYNGLTVELSEQISAEIRDEIRRKDAQITLIDRSCLQLRIRSKNYKDIICIQVTDPDLKRDWLIDVRLAKLALDRANNPAWDIVSEVNSSSGNVAMSQQRVPLFVKSLPIFATTEVSQLSCALHYKMFRGAVSDLEAGVLWICNVNESGSQLGALATNGSDISLIHSYELCDSHVTCIESVGNYFVWIGLRQGRIIVIDASSPGEWQQFAALDVASEVTCIRHFGQHVYVGLASGVVALFNATHYEEPVIVTLSQLPVTCLLNIKEEMFACSANKIWIFNGAQVERSYSLQTQQEDADAIVTPVEDMRPNLLANSGIGLWVSLIDSSIIKLFHTETFKHLQDMNVASNVKRILNEGDANIIVTSMLATRGLLWVGTNVGVLVTLTLPRLQGVPLISGCLNVALHRHIGPVTILLNLTPGAETTSQVPPSNPSRNEVVDGKNEDAESIYGLYSDLMNVGDYTGRRNKMAITTRMAWDLSNMNISDDSTSESASSGAIYQEKPAPNSTPLETNGAQAIQPSNNHIYETGEGARAGVRGAIYAGSSQLQSQLQAQIEAARQQNPRIANAIYDTNPVMMQTDAATRQPPANNAIYDTAAAPNAIYDTRPKSATAHRKRRDPIYDMGCGSKTALLLTGGNGYKRGTLNETPYSSQHDHCIIWEYKL